MSNVKTDLSQLATGTIALIATYSFQSPLLGGPSGTMDIVIKESQASEAEAAVGQITITNVTTDAPRYHLNLYFVGVPTIDGSTGYTNMETIAHGMTGPPIYLPKCEYVNVPIKVALSPTYDKGTLTIGKLVPMGLHRELPLVEPVTGDSTGNATALPKPLPVVTKILPYWRR